MRLHILTSFCILVLAFVAPVNAQPFGSSGYDHSADLFLVDHAAFQSDSAGLWRLEVYFQIYNAALAFRQANDTFFTEYELVVRVLEGSRMVDSYTQQRRVTVGTEEEMRSRVNYRTNQVDFLLPPGKYEVQLTLGDPQTNKVITREITVKLGALDPKRPRLSDIEMVQAVEPLGDVPTRFDKGDFVLVPSVSKKYGIQDELKIWFYLEIYAGSRGPDEVVVETKVRHSFRGMLYRDSITVALEEPINRQFREISIDELLPGEYELEVMLKGRRDSKLDTKHEFFELGWSENGLLKYDYQTVVSQLSIIASNEELRRLKDLETYDERLAAYEAFWLGRDPSPGTPENEMKDEFNRRVAAANEYFSSMYRKGWKSDRGRVYILFGEPDQLDDYPLVPNHRPYQEWHYYRGSRYRKFVFVDENEDGDYRLVYPYDGLNLRPEF